MEGKKRNSATVQAGARESLHGSCPARRGCLTFRPAATPARLRLPVPPGGLWIRPRTGPAVPVLARRFGAGFLASSGTALGGRAYTLRSGLGAASRGWEIQLEAQQPVLVCGAHPS